MIKFEIVSEYLNKDIHIPKRATKESAGYDIEAAESITIPSLLQTIKREVKLPKPIPGTNFSQMTGYFEVTEHLRTCDIGSIKNIVKSLKLRTMVPTGLKAKMPEGVVLKLYPRSGTGSNCLLQLANQTGIIDSDYYNNEDNEGHIFIPMINLSPFDIHISKGDKIAQGIFTTFLTTDDDNASGDRSGGFGSTDK